MKVLYITHTSTKYTGANKSLFYMLAGLKEKGVSPVVVLPKRNDMSLRDDLERIGIECHVMMYHMPVYPSTRSIKNLVLFIPRLVQIYLSNYLASRAVIKLARKKAVSLIHTNVGPVLFGSEIAKKINVKNIWHLREFQDLDFNLDTMYTKEKFKRLMREANNLPIAISQAVYDHFDLPSSAEIIYNGIMKSTEKQFLPEKEKYFLFVGYLRKNKGIDALLNAFAKVSKNQKDYKLLIAGSTNDQAYMAELKDLSNTLGIAHCTDFLGRRDDIYSLMSKASALVVPSLNEAFGRITAEAMFNGCLVIGKNTAGTKEILDKIGVGLLYNSDEELCEQLEKVASAEKGFFDDELRMAMEKAVIHFSQEQNTNRVYNLYKSII